MHAPVHLESARVEELTQALAAPFDPREVKFKPAVVNGNRALALAYVDARVIQDRLDDVLGVTGWQDEYECLPDGSVVCRLRLRIGDEWITKMDVGRQSEQPDEGDRRKAAFSDALKRAAVKFGIGRYLYRMKSQWVDYDPQKRQFLRLPALPRKETKPAAKATGLPSNGDDLHKRLAAKDAQLAEQGLCKPGELLQHVVEAGRNAGHTGALPTWSVAGIVVAAAAVKDFEAQ